MLDCHDPESLFAFWSEITGVEAARRYPDYIFTEKLPGSHIRLALVARAAAIARVSTEMRPLAPHPGALQP